MSAEEEDYNNAYDFEPEFGVSKDVEDALNFDVESINYSIADPFEIEDQMIALKILKYLKTIDKSTAEELYYLSLMNQFGIEEEDPTTLTLLEKIYIASSFKMFVRYMFLVEYGFKFKCNWHHDYICDILEQLFLGNLVDEEGNHCPRININIPPRYSKTQLLIYFVAWTMGHAPDSEYIMIGYAKMLAEESSFKVREVIQHDKYQGIFPVLLDKSSKAKDNFKTSKNGKVYATSTGGTLTGKGAGKMRKSWAGCIVIDDGNNTLDAFSETQRNKANAWVGNTLMSRRNHVDTPIINMQQRVHENDLSGFFLPSEELKLGGVGESFIHINIPAILNKEDIVRLKVPFDSDTIKHSDPEKDEYPLWHSKHTLAKLQNKRESLPSLTFFGQYQQQPYANDGEIIKTAWLLPREAPTKSEVKYTVFILDTAQTKTSRSDWSVIMVADILTDNTVYIKHIHRERLEAPDLTEKVISLYRQYKPIKIYIEYKSSGIGLIQYLKREKIRLPIHKIPRNASAGDGDSIIRANGAAPYIKFGNVYYKKDSYWVPTFLHEVMTFPNGKFDDQVDCLTDLVARELIKNCGIGSFNVENLPLKGSTYIEEVTNNPEDIRNMGGLIEYLEESGINHRTKTENKNKQKDSIPAWAIGL